ncbi:MAG: ExeA family protein [Terriglobales bacterium]
MYRKFYGLMRNPFEISPDPRFYYPTVRHNEALANLCYGIQKRKGFIVLTGQVGTGKTLLVHSLLDALRRSKIQHAYLFNPRLSADDFLRYVLSDLGLAVRSRSRAELLLDFNHYLVDLYRRGWTAALVIDEAHLLSWDLLEEVRLLTNIETSQDKLLQIVLVGQTELDTKLESDNLRQLKQRIALRCHLEPLTETEATGYIGRRLNTAGCPQTERIFRPEAVARVLAYAHGIPRTINTICESALIAGYARQMRPIEAQVIEEVAADFHLKTAAEPANGKAAGTVASNDSETELPDERTALRMLARLFQVLARDARHPSGPFARNQQGAKAE